MNSLRLAFLVPALLLTAPIAAQAAPAAKVAAPQIRYVTLDKMIRSFAEKARQQHAARATPKPAIVIATR